MVHCYNRQVKPFVEPKWLLKEQSMHWVKLTSEARAARTWANPNCTPEMIKACDAKIRESDKANKST